jgi:hypothetical protein
MQKVEAGTLDMGLGFFFKHLAGIPADTALSLYLNSDLGR